MSRSDNRPSGMEIIEVPHRHSFRMGDAACVGCGAFIEVETTRAAQVAALANLLESGTGALTAVELEALPDGSVVITVGEAFNYTWTVSVKLMTRWYQHDEQMYLSFQNMVEQKTFLLKRGGA